MSKKYWILILFIVIGGVFSASFFSKQSNLAEKELLEETDSAVQVDIDNHAEVQLIENEKVKIETKLAEDEIEKEERQIEAEQIQESKLDPSIPPKIIDKNENLAIEEEVQDELKSREQQIEEEKKRENKKELTAQEVREAKLISSPKLFRRFLNGRFTGSAKVTRGKKREVWEIEMNTKYEKDGRKLSGESTIEVTGNSINDRNRSVGSNQSFSTLEDGSILINLSPQTYIKVNRKNSSRLKGQVFEKDDNNDNYKSIGRFELARE